tara:strand:- start:38682 stop:39623 length:942 start_codon:yes stop_codon:yes gene_type:complete
MEFSNTSGKIYISGHNGMVGSAIHRGLLKKGYTNIVTRSSKELDLRNQNEVNNFFKSEKPDFVFLAAAKVGGILANSTYRAEFLYDNLMIQTNVIHASYTNKVSKLLFLGSSCIYPKMAKQPLTEEALLTGELEPTNEPYAIAKIAGIKMCEAYRDQYGVNFISAMPTNLYGPNDNYDLKTSHVLPALLRKFHEAKVSGDSEVKCWGTGSPMREFLHVDDLAAGCLHLMLTYDQREFVNIGTGTDVTIKTLAETIASIVGFNGELVWDSTKPDGTPRKLMNVGRIHASGWNHEIDLKEGIKKVYKEFTSNVAL